LVLAEDGGLFVVSHASTLRHGCPQLPPTLPWADLPRAARPVPARAARPVRARAARPVRARAARPVRARAARAGLATAARPVRARAARAGLATAARSAPLRGVISPSRSLIRTSCADLLSVPSASFESDRLKTPAAGR